MKPIYKSVLLKLSGEGMMGKKEYGVDEKVVNDLAKQIKDIHKAGVDVAVVIGGGNIFRGVRDGVKGMDRSVADQIGMIATIMNGLFLQEALKAQGLDVRVLSGLEIPKACENYVFANAKRYFEERKVLVFVGGTGCPFFTTDTGAALRACEMHVDAMLKATQVDGVYDMDPKKSDKAKKYSAISYEEVINKQLKVMDTAAVTMARDNKLPVVVFKQSGKDALMNAVCGKGEFTIIK
jgi:uridylate kinase